MGYYQQRVSPRLRPRSGRSAGCSVGLRLLLGLAVAGFALLSYFGSSEYNPVTGEEQYISISKDQEVAIGLQAAPEMAQQYGGLDRSVDAQNYLDYVGANLVSSSVASSTGYPFDFHLLADAQTVNAFALPGGQVFMTAALYDRLQTEDQVAAVLAHEIVHVIGRHGAQRIAKQELTQGLTGAVVLATYDPENPNSQNAAYIATMIANLVNLRYGREDELEADRLGVCLMVAAGYDPNAMVQVMQILDEATSGARPPEFFSTHPEPGNRIGEIEAMIGNLGACP